MFELFRSGRHLARLVRIGLTLARHDALFPLDGTAGMAPFLRVARLLRRSDRARGRPGERLAAALTELGPSFIKLGQLLSTRADLLGDQGILVARRTIAKYREALQIPPVNVRKAV